MHEDFMIRIARRRHHEAARDAKIKKVANTIVEALVRILCIMSYLVLWVLLS